MNRKINYLHFLSFIIPFILILIMAEQVYADQFTYVKFKESYRTNKIWYVHVIKMGNRLKGVKKITLKSSNIKVVFVNSEAATSGKMVFFTPQKKGKAVVTAKVTTSSGTKTYTFRIGVKTDPPAASSNKKSTKKKIKKYTVTFNPNKGSVSKKTTIVEKNGKYGTLPTPKRDYYNFKGWYTKSSGGSKVTAKSKIAKNANHTLFAHWTAKKYKITYKLNGGTNNTNNKKTFTVETNTFKLHAAKKSGYDFGGWYTDNKYKSSITKIKKGTHKNIVVYAKWIDRISITSVGDVNRSNVDTVFNALKTGTISAEMVDGFWQYKFTKGRKAVLIPVSFFYSKDNSNVPNWFNTLINDTFNTGYNSADGSSGDSANFLVKNLGFSYYPEQSNNIYTECFYQNIYKMNGQLTKNKNNFDLQCTRIDQVSFCCYDANDFGIEPTSAEDYVALISRINSSYKDTIIPGFNVTMKNPGHYSGNLYFGTYSVYGVGHKKSNNVSDLLDIGISSVKIATSLPSMSYKTFYDIYKVMNTLTETKSNTYECTGLKNLLSQQGNYCYTYKFKSPISLVNQNDKIQLGVEASLESLQTPFTGFKGTDTEIIFNLEYE